ncbi:MAG: hypothetical protein ACTSP4_03040 [Candidatus Hodarchaeales archaeon]
MIPLSEFSLDIDPQKVRNRIVQFIQSIYEKREAEGLFVVYSGQIDSYTAAKLAIESVGIDNVKLLVITEVNEERRKEIITTAEKYLSIKPDKVVRFDVNQIAEATLDSIDVPGGIPVPLRRNIGQQLLRTSIVKNLIRERAYGMGKKPANEREEFIQKAMAISKARKRLKILLAYLVADKENLLLLGKTNKTEWLTGLFTAFGYGHACDIMPLGDLYRTQVISMAEFLDIPDDIKILAYTDIIPGVRNKYRYFFKTGSRIVDKILVRLEKGVIDSTIVKELDVDIDIVKRVNHFYKISQGQRAAPLIPRIK